MPFPSPRDSFVPAIFTVIINWNGRDDLLKCVGSIKNLDYPQDRYKILVVDNASTDGSWEQLERIHPDILLIKNPKNAGYVRAVNQGIEFGLNSGVDYIWIFNNDVVVDKGTLRELVKAGEGNDRIGVIAPVIYSSAHPQVIDHAGYKINFWIGWMKKLKYGKEIFSRPSAKVEDVDSVLGCSNLVKTSVFKKIGTLMPIYGLYFEETDFNTRARQKGFRVVIVKEAKVWHKGASTMDKFIFRRAYLLLRNLFLFELLNAGFVHLLVFIPYYFLVHVPYFLIRGLWLHFPKR